MVCPIIIGTIVEARDQVNTTRFSPKSFNFSIFFKRWLATKGPFFNERGHEQFFLWLKCK